MIDIEFFQIIFLSSGKQKRLREVLASFTFLNFLCNQTQNISKKKKPEYLKKQTIVSWIQRVKIKNEMNHLKQEHYNVHKKLQKLTERARE